MDSSGFEPEASSLQGRRSTRLSYKPKLIDHLTHRNAKAFLNNVTLLVVSMLMHQLTGPKSCEYNIGRNNERIKIIKK